MSMHAYRPVDADMPHLRESADWGTDPDSGARIIRLTTSVAISHNIYCEQPYGSPDGRRLIIFRTADSLLPHCQLLIIDLEARDTTLVEADVPSESVGHVSWGEWVYYPMHDGSLRRVSLMTLAREEVLPVGSIPAFPACWIDSISSDDRYVIAIESDGDSYVTSAIDLHSGDRHVLADGPENRNPHPQMSLDDPARLLYQMIVEPKTTGEPLRVVLNVRDLVGGEPSRLPIGDPWTAESSGHMAWIANTGRVACAVSFDRENRCHDPRHPEGNLVYVAPGDERPTVFPAPDFGFYHVSVSRCGRYFVCDDFMHFQATGPVDGKLGPCPIVIGNFETGKSKALLRDCQNYGIAGYSRFEPNPYLTADSRYVIYNASPFGTMQVFAAELPDDFLGDLD